MKFSLALFAAATAEVELSADTVLCQEQNADLANCWAPYGQFASANATAPDYDSEKPFILNNSAGECGFQYVNGQSLANSTCTYNFGAVDGAPQFGNAAFVTASGVLAGLDFSGDVSIIQKWNADFPVDEIEIAFNQALSAHIDELETNPNATFSWENPAVNCWEGNQLSEYNVDCTDNGAPTEELAIMITNQEDGAATNQYAIANYGAVVAVELGVSCTSVEPLDANAASITISNTEVCAFTIEVSNPAAQLLYFQAAVSAPIDFFGGAFSLQNS